MGDEEIDETLHDTAATHEDEVVIDISDTEVPEDTEDDDDTD